MTATPPRASAPVEQAVPAAVDRRASADATAKSSEFVIAPLPVINPTLDYGVALVVGYCTAGPVRSGHGTVIDDGRGLQDQQRRSWGLRPHSNLPSP